MTGFVALLRGVNVGGARPLPMAALRRALTRIGLADARTYLQSGNVVFSADGGDAGVHALAIRSCIAEEFGLEVDTLVVPCAEVARIAAENPFLAENPDLDPRWLHVAFPLEPVAAETFGALAPPSHDGERAVLGDGAVYLLLSHGVGRSKLAAGLERMLKTGDGAQLAHRDGAGGTLHEPARVSVGRRERARAVVLPGCRFACRPRRTRGDVARAARGIGRARLQLASRQAHLTLLLGYT